MLFVATVGSTSGDKSVIPTVSAWDIIMYSRNIGQQAER